MKIFTIKFIFLFIFLLLFAANIYAVQYQGIVPFKSTRADVERLLGNRSSDNQVDHYVTYNFETEDVSIGYITEYDISMCSKDLS